MTSRRSEGGKAPGPTRARCILKATKAVLKIATTPTANGMAVTAELLGHLKIRRAVRRCRPQDHLTAKGQGLWCGMGPHDRFSTALFIVSQGHLGGERNGHGPLLITRKRELHMT